ncbi:MAG: 5-(carboxyamino)imidazole ribonucleotide synthase [Chloroflexi bacterium]|nr:MAG: 5-(carboxyamino)imidazole ribonucleotide synthase [Chloroflexota bacterium]
MSERISVFPGVAALAAAQDRVAEKRLFAEVGLETAAYAPVTTDEDCRLALATVGSPAILKTRRLGYDGKGQALVHTVAECEAAWKGFGEVPCILEERVPFERELSLVAVRGTDGRSAFYPWAENVHRDGMLRVTRAPAENVLSEPERAARTGLAQMLERLQYVGVLAVEFFEVDGRLLANEFAPRVHNTGHWTIDGAVTSQFENHLRAVCGLPLGATEALGAAGMVNLIGNHPTLDELLAVPDLHVHLYGKSARPGRKLGHVNVLRRTTDEREAALVALDRLLTETDTARSRP